MEQKLGKPVRFFPEILNFMSAEERQEHKNKMLRESVEYMYKNSPEFYQVKFKEFGLEPGDIKTFDDLRKVPVLMDKDSERISMEESLERYNHPFGLHVCADPNDIILTGGTSGTTGHPTYPYSVTEADTVFIDDAIAFMHDVIWGVGKGDRAWFVFPLGVYATTVAMLGGIRKAGILQLPIDIRLGPQPAFDLAKWTRPTFVWTGPTIMMHYLKLWEEQGIDPRDFNFKILATTGEKGIDEPAVKGKLEDALGCRMYDFWSPSQTNICTSCNSDEFYGLHNFTDDYDSGFDDLVDPETKEPVEVKEGAVGEIVITALRKRGAPYFKYATGDIAEVHFDECPGCGFKGGRGKIIGRADDMLTVKGVNVFGAVLLENIRKAVGEKVTGHMFIIRESSSPKITDLKVIAEYAPGQEGNLEQLQKEISNYCKAHVRCNPTIEWAEPETLPRYARKTPVMMKRY
jgi:phenylacetate-CoA ligase